FLYDGLDVVQDQGSDGSSTSYTNGATIDEKLEQNGANGPLYFTQDRLGSTTTLTDATANVVETESYDAFGGAIGSAYTRYGFTGRELDPETGLMLYRARWYDPSQGRFVTEDPVGYRSGLNLYSYVGNSPLGWIDPTGFGPDSPWWDPGDFFAGPTGTKILGVVGTASAGFGDTISGGLTSKARDLTGANSAVDKCSGWYTGGRYAGYAWQVLGVAASAASISSLLSGVADEGGLVTVSRWGRPGLEAGDWVMKGEANWWNYIWSGKGGPSIFGNQFASFSSGASYEVPASSLEWPSGWEFFKGLFGQRIYNP
ncbi:MAG TPA: RHS repeat-associated core domain-containing protein, partial [Blastocatellia bacterium]